MAFIRVMELNRRSVDIDEMQTTSRTASRLMHCVNMKPCLLKPMSQVMITFQHENRNVSYD